MSSVKVALKTEHREELNPKLFGKCLPSCRFGITNNKVLYITKLSNIDLVHLYLYRIKIYMHHLLLAELQLINKFICAYSNCKSINLQKP